MLTLFPLDPIVPSGFQYLPEFLTKAEEEMLLVHISELNFHTFNFHGYQAKRRVASFGVDWNFETRQLTQGKEIPPIYRPLIDKVSAQLQIPKGAFKELLVTEYPVGSVINWHRDAPPFNIIAGISLLSDCIFRFRPYDKAKQGRSSIVSIPIARRSLYIMEGACRNEQEHSILPVKKVRYSITLRTLKD